MDTKQLPICVIVLLVLRCYLCAKYHDQIFKNTICIGPGWKKEVSDKQVSDQHKKVVNHLMKKKWKLPNYLEELMRIRLNSGKELTNFNTMRLAEKWLYAKEKNQIQS